MRDIERYLNVRSAYGASFSPGGTLAFLYDATGVSQVWTLAEPRAWPEQRTFYDESVGFVDCSPTREELVFGMDEGGNERTQLHRLDLAGGVDDVTNLTDRPGAKHRWGGWSHDGDRFAFASNRRDESVFDVYVQDRDAVGGDTDLVHEGSGWLTVQGWSPDDSRLLVSEAYSNFDQDVYVLDLESGEFVHLTPHEGTARFVSATWGPDGGVYLATDHDRDTLSLVRFAPEDLGAGLDAMDPVVEDSEWNVEGIAVDHDTRRAVYSKNVDGYTELTVGDIDGTEFTERSAPALPKGVAGGVSFDADATSMALTATGSSANTNVYGVDVDTGEADRWTCASTAGIPRESFVEPDLVRFESFDGLAVPAFFSLPHEVPEGGAPVVVDIHGGPESQRRPSFNSLKQYFLAHGYAVFEPNVRGSTGYGTTYTHLDDVEKRMDSVRDVEAGVEWLHAQDTVDPDRIVAFGGSYGGFMVLAALTEYPDRWAAGVDVVGIANFVTFLENTGSWRRELREAEYGSLAEDREFLESISPINNIEKIRAPLFVLHGANDPRVPLGEAEQIVEEAREQGVPVEELIFEDEGHGIAKRENRIEAYSRVVAFLDDHV
ncbi:S9 family peptidase [Halomarina litorea]|uniref:S9 family peptidase n=1 Tax=Halomarina litorea TaxID=2961595 RepID=UPI0020C49316|nr:S9 family peptidase [Halomarina sp. BCD28]